MRFIFVINLFILSIFYMRSPINTSTMGMEI